MEQYPVIIFSSLVFLISLFLFKAIVLALVITFIFVLLSLVFEKFWRFKETPAFFVFLKASTNLIIAVILALSVFALIYFPLEFRITEIWLLTPKIPPLVGVIFLIFLVFAFELVNWQKLVKIKFSWLLMLEIVILIATSIFVYREIHHQKLALEYLPKIYRISRDWGIQGQKVEIRGVNFFPGWKKGKVVLDGEEMLVRFWDERLIIAEQQVPSKFGKMNLYIVRKDGVASNSFPFEVRDPKELINF